MRNRRVIPISLISVLLLITIYMCTCFISYRYSLKNFKDTVIQGNYNEAHILVSNNKLNIISRFKINKDISSFLVDYLSKLNDEYLEGKISQENLLVKLNLMENLNIAKSEILSFKNTLPLIEESKNNYAKALDYYNSKSYNEALEYFNKVSPLDTNYIECLSYKDECISILKQDLLAKIETFKNTKEYSNGIELIESNLDRFDHNIDLLNKLDELEKLRINHLVEYSENNINTSTSSSTPVSAYYNKLNSDTINTFDIDSQTTSLIFVNISEQKTYVYTGSKNGWKLEKEFLCSTGIEGQETPVGVFTVQTRAPWFYSPQYGQGGKYYVQFMGNYLFHSVPFAEDQETIVDETLGKPASHGCIRLSVDDSKWLYDNVSDGSKVIIY